MSKPQDEDEDEEAEVLDEGAVRGPRHIRSIKKIRIKRRWIDIT